MKKKHWGRKLAKQMKRCLYLRVENRKNKLEKCVEKERYFPVIGLFLKWLHEQGLGQVKFRIQVFHLSL